MKHKLDSAVLGFIVGDALGVPVEFEYREDLKLNPVVDMREFGTYNQPRGTWSDDTTMTLCLMESLSTGELNYEDICSKFLAWVKDGYMTPHGELFDIGFATRKAIQKFSEHTPPLKCGGTSELDNGNGSLMRILPLAFYTVNMSVSKRFEIVENVSALTHGHKRARIACVLYVQFICELLKGRSRKDALTQAIIHIQQHYREEAELEHYDRIISGKIIALKEDDIKSSGYVVATLEAVLWCFLTTDCYADCVLKAVNLGGDTDTIASIAGSLAGLYYGLDSIPKEWISTLAKLDMIHDVCDKFTAQLKL